ncbi:diguanylate cyclase/phosphodiesterase with GAF sensor [Paraglaciecola sp. T6c]|uniref:bifunctional diguanylate cyclase/phosphodiesterase n=1 Tax=Pseudoalteromonas atlantica (strain T6c / ATCC BAA-1087) TaxID=3042615 RepID=UPI00005C743C|nr:EAL domain-containing protein [Paraglaciecola sp. T6c]ABG40771.1 diguanylate cyclase/phosphodiesterase with GAF sensor [Paraglaciecola sp. T6c]
MKAAPRPSNDKQRVSALHELNILDTVAEERFDRITRLAAHSFGCQFASISFIDEERQWYKSVVNFPATDLDRNISFCAHTITQDKALVVKDAHLSACFKDHPYVVSDPFLRFYAGIKITMDGYHVGSLCVFDTQPKSFTCSDELILQDLANMVESELQKEQLTHAAQTLRQYQNKLNETQKLTRVRNTILEKIVHSVSLTSVLHEIVKAVELEYLNQKCSILLLKDKKLLCGAAPSLPSFYNDAINGLDIGIGQGSCGTTAFTGVRTVVEDISSHPYWSAWTELAEKAELGACWSEPVKASDGTVLGTFAIYHAYPAAPSTEELQRIEQFAYITSIAIERQNNSDLIWHQANFDELTQLPNRNIMGEHLKQALNVAKRNQTQVAVLFLDLDNFKDINDTLGHSVGDDLLVDCAQRIKDCIRHKDIVARLGGDEFVVIINDIVDFSGLEKTAQKILKGLSRPYHLQSEIVHTSASIGITIYPDDADDVSSLLKNADQAMYGAKAIGKNNYHYYTKNMRDAAVKRMALITDLRHAIDNDEFFIVYQPIINLLDQSITKAEALIRWRHPIRGLVGPDDFIPVAEETGLIIDISDWVFEQVCRDVCQWRQALCPTLQISINTSPVHYTDPEHCITLWLEKMLINRTPPQAVLLEITESLLMDANKSISTKLFQFRQAGVDIALDDFGTGYSSISYLKRYPTDFLKIDKSFVHSMTEVSNDKVLCEAIIVMAKKLGIKVVAEGIETQEQYHILQKMGCDYGQGYLFAKPLEHHAFNALLQQHKAT